MNLDFESPPPVVRLVAATERPLDLAVAAARSCIARGGLVLPGDVAPPGDAVARARRDALADDLLRAGHHTVFQHPHLVFALDRVSRHAVWTFLHAHPFYNSEQVSQRYVAVREGAHVVPRLPDPGARALWIDTVRAQHAAYRRLVEILEPIAFSLWAARWPARARRPERWRGTVRKKALEAARYVLPVATWTRMLHTVSLLTLLRYRRLARQADVPSELGLLVGAMWREALRVDPDLERLGGAFLEGSQMPEARALADAAGDGGPPGDPVELLYDPSRARRFRERFDASLGGHVSRLVDWGARAEGVVAEAVREVLGLPEGALDDDAAIALLLDPARNPLRSEALNLDTVAKLTRALHHAHYTFRRKLSHAADSQDQRHRTTPASRPVLLAQVTDEPDVVVPALVRESDEALRLFEETCARAWDALGALHRRGVPAEALVYLLPNAVAVRYTESADFVALRHKHAMRLCLNAQEEIWHASLDEARQVREVHPRLGRWLLPPCALRKRGGRSPWCPEGRRYCGVPAWRVPLDDLHRVL